MSLDGSEFFVPNKKPMVLIMCVCVSELVVNMGHEFKACDMGSPSFFLGIEAILHGDGMLLSQQRYTKEILKRASMVDCKALATLVSLVWTEE